MMILTQVANVLLISLVHARAGGGHSFSGGHSSGGSHVGGGGGGADIGYLLYLYFRMVARHPLIGLPMTCFLAYVAYRIYSASQDSAMFTSDERISETISRGAAAQQQDRKRANLERLKARDADFDEAAFLMRASAAFGKIQDAWSRQQMDAARAFVSDGVMERFSIQIEMQKADRIRNHMGGVKVLDARILEVESDAHFDAVHVIFRASAIDTDVSLDDGSVVRGNQQRPEEFEEVWSFLRRPGAKTLKKPGLVEGFCPSCGAPLELADAAQCAACKSWVNSGQYDWVLAEITQLSEWAVRGAGENVPGFKMMADGDPAINVEFLEDRASVVFWRWQQALSQGSGAELRGAATDELCALIDAQARGRTEFYRDASVGAVEVLALEPGETMDRAHVSVLWSGLRASVKDGKTAAGEQVLRQHVVILSRKSGVATDARSGLRSLRCAACGAPPSSREIARCEYCQAPFNDGSRQWVATSIVPLGMWARPAAAGAGGIALDLDWAQNLSSAQALSVLVAAMLADGRIDPQEQAFLDAYAKKQGVAPEMVAALIEAGKNGQLKIPMPQDSDAAAACLKGFIRMSLADGSLSEGEMALMIAFGAKMSLGEAQVRALVRKERMALYRQAKGVLKSVDKK